MDAESRFRAKLVRRGNHDVWTGARGASGTGLVRIDGKLRTVQRAAWEFAYGPLPTRARVMSCEVERACARVAHLRLEPFGNPPSEDDAAPAPRRPRGSGSKREVSPGVWHLMVSDGPGRSGRPRRRTMRVHGSETQADEVLKAFAETAIAPSRMGDLRVRELIDRYLSWIDDVDSVELTRLRHLADNVIDPGVGRHFAALLKDTDIIELLDHRRDAGATSGELRELRQLVSGAYRWVRNKGWTSLNPTADVGFREVGR
jgi:hypothetical protein